MSRKRPGDARTCALHVLSALEEQDGFLQPTLQGAAQKMQLDARDRALALELVMGVCRWRMRLDHAMAAHLAAGLDATPPVLQRILRLALYQLDFLDRVPAHAAVHDAVELARRAAGERSGALVNAVLRAHLRAPAPPSPHAADHASVPRCIWSGWMMEGGPEWAAAAAAAANEAAPLSIRADGDLDREALIDVLTAEGVTAEAAAHAPDAIHLRARGAFELPSFRARQWRAQDEASQLVAELVGARPGMHLWDACAAPGGKSRALARRMGGEGALLATDTHPVKTRRLGRTLVDLPVASARLHDAETPIGQTFDAVLLDAPCSGLGVIRRHPEIKWRRRPEDVFQSAEAQGRLLRAVADAVRPGGTLIYSVCSDRAEEGPTQIARFLAAREDFKLIEPPEGRVDWAPLMHEGALRLRPHLQGTDAFYAVRLRRREGP